MEEVWVDDFHAVDPVSRQRSGQLPDNGFDLR